MTLPAARLTDACECSKCLCPPPNNDDDPECVCVSGVVVDGGTSRTFINGLPAVVVGPGRVRCTGPCGAGEVPTVSGSATVIIENHAAWRLTDLHQCGTCIQGSPNVFVGG